jgi:hypothetical protein
LPAVAAAVHQLVTEQLAQEHYLKLMVKRVLQVLPFLVIQQELEDLEDLEVIPQDLIKVAQVVVSQEMVRMVDHIARQQQVVEVTLAAALEVLETDVGEVIIMVATAAAVAAN